MRTLIFDIDGTLTDMGPIERAVFGAMASAQQSGISKAELRAMYVSVFEKFARTGKLPTPRAYRTVNFIRQHASEYCFVYATGARRVEADFVLDSLGIAGMFDLKQSISIDDCRFSKLSGIPFKRLKRLFPDSLVITDGSNDIIGAHKAGLPAIQLKPNEKLVLPLAWRAVSIAPLIA